ncbi:MAG TPA: sulfatase, partial [Thermoanaerobaculia bacterium]|nr:sulfatase [Thermoanaerobaculia bacterium]
MRPDTEQQNGSWIAQAGALLLLAFVAWISDVILASAGGLRRADLRFILPSAGLFLALAWMAIAGASSVPLMRRRLFPVGAVLLMLPASGLLWVQRLAWRPAEHHIGTAPWIVITVALIVAPFALACLRPSWLIPATSLLVLGYHGARISGAAAEILTDRRIVVASGLALASFLLCRVRVSGTMQKAALTAFGVIAVAGTAIFIAWSDKTFVHQTIRPGRADATLNGGNIVLIVIDTLRADRLGTYGYRIRETSPFLDRFASTATTFRNAYASTSWTVPSVATMFTGLPPELHGVTVFGRSLPAGKSTLAEMLGRRGYHTIGISTNPLIDRDGGFARGFDRFTLLTRMLSATGRGGSLWSDAIITLQRGSREGWLPGLFVGWTVKPRAEDAVDELLRQVDAAPGRQPLFLFLHLLDPHHPPSVLGDAASARWRITESDQHFDPVWSLGYDREIRYVDSQLDRLIGEVDRRLDPNRTTIAIVADHGEQLGEDSKRGHGLNLDEAVLRVPLIIRRPAQTGQVIEEP